MSGIVIGEKNKTPKGDFGGNNYAIKTHPTSNQTKFKVNSKVLKEVVTDSNLSALMVPIYNRENITYFCGFEYIDTEDSKKLPPGKLTKSGIFANKNATNDMLVKTDEDGIIYLNKLEPDGNIVVPTEDSGNMPTNITALAEIISNQYKIKLNTFVVYEITTSTPNETITADAEPTSEVAELTEDEPQSV